MRTKLQVPSFKFKQMSTTLPKAPSSRDIPAALSKVRFAAFRESPAALAHASPGAFQSIPTALSKVPEFPTAFSKVPVATSKRISTTPSGDSENLPRSTEGDLPAERRRGTSQGCKRVRDLLESVTSKAE
ncbi:hypothetical protein NDU88_004239 [Pleurodeles waltl]|uniref:Uncharacterized protein n=1 Tax=Pleurodeles waltl TaxID=8319 RepID=A0AAV7PC71_PLEWA|nr:hypothetical protein NDU88_004239 [Pleurodeles waltl]